jgi:hypothetical protein
MNTMIGYCGYRCHLCAARSPDPAIRQKLVEGWKRLFGHQHYTAENVYCVGCKNEGKVADQQCKARPCAQEKGVNSCVECDEFPCDKMKHLMATREGMFIFCLPRTTHLTKKDYELCMRQFESMPELIKKLVQSGKLPPWTEEVP